MDYLIYLGGPITGLTWSEATLWRKQLIERFKDASTPYTRFIALSPLRDKEYLSNEKDIKDSYEAHTMPTEKAITERNFYDVKRSNLVLMNFLNSKRISIGSLLEVGSAKTLNKPLIIAMEENNIHQYSMVRQSCIMTCDNLDDLFYFSLHVLGVIK